MSPLYKEYIKSSEWRAKTANYQRRSGGRCVLLPWLFSNSSHHLSYRNLGHEEYIRDCIPISNVAHQWIHFSSIGSWFWDKDKARLRRSLMNFVLRLMAIAVSIYAHKFGMKKPKLKNRKGSKIHT